MIQYFNEENIRTTGCGCCSEELDPKRDKEQILSEARKNIAVVTEVCRFYGIDLEEFVSRRHYPIGTISSLIERRSKMIVKLFEIAKVNGEMVETFQAIAKLAEQKRRSGRLARKLARIGRLDRALEEGTKEILAAKAIEMIRSELKKELQ